MRNVLTAAVLLSASASALAAPDIVFADFIEAVPQLYPADNTTLNDASGLELLKRQTGCANGYRPCDNLNAGGLCCRTNQVCSADAANNVACCPLNVACTGTVEPISRITASPTTTDPFGPAPTTTTDDTPPAPTASFEQSGERPTRSLVPNDFYPFPAIPTTYTNAAACSSAYTSCRRDAASCSQALASGVPGVTISGPNGGATVTAIASLGPVSASAICASLSREACSGLIVEACTSFGGDSGAPMTRCAPLYGVGAGVAVGIAGQLLN